MRRTLLAVLGGLVGLVALTAATGWLLRYLEDPEPPTALFEGPPTVDLAAYDGSDPSADGGSQTPSILVLGTPHFAQEDHDHTREEFDRVASSLAEFEPDLVAVEYLPADWPRGEGRDYRPTLDHATLESAWDLPMAEAEELARAADDHPEPCEIGRAHFLTGREATAGLWWDRHSCTDPLEVDGETGEALAEWWQWRQEDEDGLIAHPVADAQGIDELAAIDDQGDDTEWFIYDELLSLDALTSPGDVWQLLPEVSPGQRQYHAHERDLDSLDERLHHLNSPDWIGLQYWNYEQLLAEVELGDDAGRRQVDNYWERNQRMFDRLQAAAEERDADRVLVVTGAGHKYFLDELARDAGWRWVDPREYLPAP